MGLTVRLPADISDRYVTAVVRTETVKVGGRNGETGIGTGRDLTVRRSPPGALASSSLQTGT